MSSRKPNQPAKRPTPGEEARHTGVLLERLGSDVSLIAGTVAALSVKFDEFDRRLTRVESDVAVMKIALQTVIKETAANTKAIEANSKILKDHSRILEDHSKILENHSRLLEDHSRLLENHSKRLEKLTEAVERNTKAIERVDAKLSSFDERLSVVESRPAA